MKFVAIDNSCGYTAMALRDIAPGEEIFAFYGTDYFQDMAGGCPCRSCKPEVHEQWEAEKEEHQNNQQCSADNDKAIIEKKRKEQKKRRRENQKGKAREVIDN